MNLKNYITGNFSKREFTHIVIPALLISFFSFLFLAWVFFPPELNYNIFKNSISHLGSKEDSPNGWYFFSIAIMIWGIQLIPIILYIHRRLKNICKFTTTIGTFFGLLGCIFVFFIGIIIDDSSIIIFDAEMSRVHVIVAAIGMGSIGVCILFYYFPIFKDTFFKRGNRQFPFVWVTIAYTLILFGGFGMGIAELIKAQQDIGWPGPGFLSFTFWEWALMIIFNIFLSMASFFLPEEVQMLKDKN